MSQNHAYYAKKDTFVLGQHTVKHVLKVHTTKMLDNITSVKVVFRVSLVNTVGLLLKQTKQKHVISAKVAITVLVVLIK